MHLYCTAGRGTECFASDELRNKVSIDSMTVIEGKVIFAVKGREESTINTLRNLKSVERLFACVLQDDEFRLCGKRSLYKLYEVIERHTRHFEDAYNVWKLMQLEDDPSDSEVPNKKRQKLNTESGQTKLTFRVSSKCSSTSKVTTKDIARTVSAAIKRKLGWEVNLRSPAIEVSVQLNDSGLLIGLPVTRTPLSQRSYIKHIGLRSTVSWIMADLLQIQSGDVILDPMCGCGTILMECAEICPNAVYIGNDCSTDQIAKFFDNIVHGSVEDKIYALLGNSLALPFSNRSLDGVVCDLPFGSKFLCKDDVLSLYPAVLKEIDRLLADNARVVLLTSSDLVDYLIGCINENDVEHKLTDNDSPTLNKGNQNDQVNSYHSKNSLCAKSDCGARIASFCQSDKFEPPSKEILEQLRWTFKGKHYIKLGETHAYICKWTKNCT